MLDSAASPAPAAAAWPFGPGSLPLLPRGEGILVDGPLLPQGAGWDGMK